MIGSATFYMPILALSLAGITLIILVMGGPPYSGHSFAQFIHQILCSDLINWMERQEKAAGFAGFNTCLLNQPSTTPILFSCSESVDLATASTAFAHKLDKLQPAASQPA